jgi:type II secretory pathway component PulF
VPLSSATLSVIYAQLAQQLAAGLTFAQALRTSSAAPAGDTQRLAALAESGLSIPEIIASAGDWLPADDRPFLAAAARSGRLPRILVNLSERHGQIAQTRSRLFFASLYPLGVFHFGAVVFPFLRMIDFQHGLQWSLAGYLGGVLAIILPAWISVITLWILVRRKNPLALAFLDRLPAIGGYRRHQALADFSFSLGNLLEGGVPIDRAWLAAGEIARSPRIASAAKTIHAGIELGEAPGPHLARIPAFPPAFAARYQTGETTGSLDHALLALAAEHQAVANTRLKAATMIYPGLLFAAVALMIAWIVISFALQYYGQLNAIMDGM